MSATQSNASAARKYIIALDIQTISPLTISSGETGRYDPSTGKMYTSGKMGVECAFTHKLPVVSKARMVQSKDEKTGQVTGEYLSIPRVPVIPASTLGGRLRRSAAELIFESLAGRGLTISVDAANTLMSGSPTTNIVQTNKVEVIQMARKDPFLGVFGGTTFMLTSGSVVCTGWPITFNTLELLMTEPLSPENVQAIDRIADMTSPEKIIRKNDVRDMRGSRFEAVVKADEVASYVENEGKEQSQSKINKDDDTDGRKTNIRTFNAVEVINTGLNFALRFEVTARSDAHLGLMLLAVQNMLRLGQLGGKGARGHGLFVCSQGNSRLYERDPQTNMVKPVSMIYKDRATGYDFVEDTVLGNAVSAAQDYLDDVSPALLNAFGSGDEKAIVVMAKSAQSQVEMA